MPRILMERSGEMEVFARVVQEGGFSDVRSLDLTPSAVSKLIARLEARQRTNATLTQRPDHGVYPVVHVIPEI